MPQGLPRQGVRPHRILISALGQSLLPGINGIYDPVTCNTKMSRDVEEAAEAMAASDEEVSHLASTMNAFEEAVLAMPKGDGEPEYGVKYCRIAN